MASSILYCFVVLAATVSTILAASCSNPEVTATSFTTQDATIVTNIAFIAEFTLKCSPSVPSGIPLYAEIDGKVMPTARIGDNKYQVSWTEEINNARSGDHKVRLYDEEGYTAVRKAMRSGEDASAVRSLVTIVISHPGAFTGPWVNSELVASLAAVGVAYLAFTSKYKLLL
ncbi:translocon-associated protein subunit delta-like [Ctenocephalides felis]|uniref:translocon-associated protein subunit delta-like n=1 Tax=Ctenocephalides felis TaxID=7515 RepID=UPI000E6E5652|nr:translocon-associated protein subunit delta-like [Ctenocephalides felis]XP_026474382.1 translocon-associated protein subunit delta-like [Ctenocephalides felis]